MQKLVLEERKEMNEREEKGTIRQTNVDRKGKITRKH